MIYTIFRSDMPSSEKIIELLIIIIAMAFSLSIHEFMHAWVAEKMGDETPRAQGRISLNPLAHLDPMGTIMLLLAGFGWGKPVEVNIQRFKRFKRPTCERFVSLAGVGMNFLAGTIGSLLLVLAEVYIYSHGYDGSLKEHMIWYIILKLLLYTVEINFGLMAFNLIPVPPLDGYRFVYTFIPYSKRHIYDGFAQTSQYIFLGLIVLERVANVSLLGKLVEWIEWPFRTPVNALCEWLFNILI